MRLIGRSTSRYGGLRSFLTQLFRSFWRGLLIFNHHLPSNDDHVGWLVNLGLSPSLSAHEATHWKVQISVSTTSWPRLAKVFPTFTRSKAWPKRSSTPRNLRVAPVFIPGPIIPLMAEIRLTSWGKGSLSHYLQGFMHARWLFGISSINGIISKSWLIHRGAYFRVNFRIWIVEGSRILCCKSRNQNFLVGQMDLCILFFLYI